MKAKAVLQKMLTVGARQEEVTEALAELQSLESYIERCIEKTKNKQNDILYGKCEAYTDILQKIKGEKCEKQKLKSPKKR